MKEYIETLIWELQQKRYQIDEDKETLKFLYNEKARLEKNDTTTVVVDDDKQR